LVDGFDRQLIAPPLLPEDSIDHHGARKKCLQFALQENVNFRYNHYGWRCCLREGVWSGWRCGIWKHKSGGKLFFHFI